MSDPASASVQDRLSGLLAQAVASLLPQGEEPPLCVFERSRPDFASDYQSAVAMQLARTLRRPPRDIAGQLAELLAESAGELVEAPEVSGPGFLGVRVSEACLAGELARCLGSERLNVPQECSGTVVIDYSSPNVAKRMHIGHIRSTVIGDALRRMGSFLGYKVIADNHIGDWGTQFGQLIYAYRNWLDAEQFDQDPVGELERLYVRFHKEADASPELHDAAREELRKLQAGDPDNFALWTLFRRSSRDAFDSLYDRLGVEFDVTHGESHYKDALGPLVEDLLEQGIAEHSEGAVCVFFRDEHGEDTMTPFLVQKKDGAHLYATTDLATVQFREKEWSPVRMIYVTGGPQQLHFRQVFETSRRMGVTTDMVHVWFGMMSLPEGAFSTRKGNVILLDELLDEAEGRARALQVERLEARGETWSEDELDRLARTLGLGAVKYADLSNNPQTNVVFSFDRMLSFEGNTAPYLQYTSARTNSLARKATDKGLPPPDGRTFVAAHDADRELLLHTLDLGRRVAQAFDEGKPSFLATYLHELATKYHHWYAACPVIQADDEALALSRLNLNQLARRSLVLGLDLLGIGVPERM
ncbi:MAG TPA: arginine--tRNA ligase [Deltaproteobacteria bacterium]|mgnify:CR=1 FL=1|nr:arginine--tRNA ligase [Deltaproteobacteria bacterium]HCP45636.1 arginine--tRNA ligase [Deltaproteobacteria bacterium]